MFHHSFIHPSIAIAIAIAIYNNNNKFCFFFLLFFTNVFHFHFCCCVWCELWCSPKNSIDSICLSHSLRLRWKFKFLFLCDFLLRCCCHYIKLNGFSVIQPHILSMLEISTQWHQHQQQQLVNLHFKRFASCVWKFVSILSA